MNLQALPAPRFIRRTSLGPNEYRKNFRQIDRETIKALTSPEADAVTPLMSKIYLRMIDAPAGFWESEGVLRFESEVREAGRLKAWSVLCELLGVASATARKALRWMHEQGIIGYYAGKNGVGIRVFLNRAASSIGKKILRFSPASNGARHASPDETAFKDSYAVSENVETDCIPRAPKNGADKNREVKAPPEKAPPPPPRPAPVLCEAGPPRAAEAFALDEIVRRLRAELEPCVRSAAAQAAAREHERTREWLEKSGIPKATRVAQHEAYNVLRSHGVIGAPERRSRPGLETGRGGEAPSPAAGPLTPEEVAEMAETCVSLLEAQGKPVDSTLSGVSSEGGGWLLQGDVEKVRAAAKELLRERAAGKQNSGRRHV